MDLQNLLAALWPQLRSWAAWAYACFTPEVISNLLDALAFLLVTPEFLPLRRRRYIEQYARALSARLLALYETTPFQIVHWTLVFPFTVAFATGALYYAREVARWVVRSQSPSIGTYLKYYGIGILVFSLALAIYGDSQGERKGGEYPRYYTALLLFVSSAFVILDTFHEFPLSSAVSTIGIGVLVSIAWMWVVGILFAADAILSHVSRYTLFWVGVAVFMAARVVKIIQSVHEVHGGG